MANGIRSRAALLGALVVTAGCAAPGASLETAPDVVVWSVAASLRDPVWSYRTHALVALTGDRRLAAVRAGDRPGDATTRLSAPMSVGRNLQISQKDDRIVFVPQPERGRVAEVDLQSLREVGDFDAGPAPAYLSEDAGRRTLLALSADGKSVTPVDQYGLRKLATAPITGDPADSIDGANRGRQIEYHAYAPSGIRHYQGTSSPAEQRGSLRMNVAVSAGDGAAVTRSYVAGHDDATLYAVDSRRGGDGLTVLASTRLPSPIRELGTDDTRIYAATDREVVVLETASFTGFPAGTIPVIRVIGYRAGLPPAIQSAPLSGMAVGPHRVYLTLADAPYVVSVAKPRL
ncbi:hypothetical protein KXD96_09990 [Mycobacterium sp. SMC-2]|uniref:hypothetical protein n=1 Tax=Mycobacterium sp. SMC-2 TaxID=2857058 RepID=UPI0021B2A375|nr:hypothetical protein [Mycobacterium sp. SMC-2]UXA08381.1 hypothetical protein KXD96_09990 [Mycobacterium sp. SMC-2]